MNNQTESAFWLVWCPTGSKAPSFRHPSAQSAAIEAERLARLHAGDLFVIMESVGARRVDPMVRTEFVGGTTDMPPF